MSVKLAYVYGLSSSEDPEKIRYIGVSVSPEERLKDHKKESKTGHTKKCRWIKSQLNKNNNIVLTILFTDNIENIYNREIEFISMYKSLGFNLLNHNNGGIGGIIPDKETRDKISKGNKGKIKTEKQLESIKRVRENFYNDPIKLAAAKEKWKISGKRPQYKTRKLTENQVIEIFKLNNEGKSLKEIGEILNLSKTTLNNLLYNKKRYYEIKQRYGLQIRKLKARER